MTRPLSPLSRLSLPITAQVLILVLVAIVVAQLITIFAVTLAPVLPPPRYKLDEVVTAFRGGHVDNKRHRPLRQRTQAKLPNELNDHNNPVQAANLAKALGTSPDAIRLVSRAPVSLVAATSGKGAAFHNAIPAPPPTSTAHPPWPEHTPPLGRFDGPPGYLPPDAGPPIDDTTSGEDTFGEFIAAERQADGQWLIVEPSPEWEWLRRVAIWLIGGMAVMAPLAWVFATRVTRPIRQFATAAERLGCDPSAEHVPVDGPAEIGQAASAFNTMAMQLQRYVADRVSMMGAISHDLRTPLTRIRFKIERADPTLRDSVMSDVLQMETMISDVLAFIRDSDQKSPREALDLTSLVNCAIDDHATDEKALVYDENNPCLIVEGDPIALRRLFDNLIDNAIKYGNCAQVRIKKEGANAIVVIQDNGPGLSVDALEKVFTPFYRTPDALAQPGSGLGLSIARSVARAHGGDVVLMPSETGLIAEVTLPLASVKS